MGNKVAQKILWVLTGAYGLLGAWNMVQVMRGLEEGGHFKLIWGAQLLIIAAVAGIATLLARKRKGWLVLASVVLAVGLPFSFFTTVIMAMITFGSIVEKCAKANVMPFGSSVAGICAHAVVGAVTRLSGPREIANTSSARISIPAALLAAINSSVGVGARLQHPLKTIRTMPAAAALRTDEYNGADFIMCSNSYGVPQAKLRFWRFISRTRRRRWRRAGFFRWNGCRVIHDNARGDITFVEIGFRFFEGRHHLV
jgi:hypothetical protein